MQRWQCPIYNGTLETQKCGRYNRFSDWKCVYFCDFLHCFLIVRNAQITFTEKPNNGSENQKKNHGFWALSSYDGESLEITV